MPKLISWQQRGVVMSNPKYVKCNAVYVEGADTPVQYHDVTIPEVWSYGEVVKENVTIKVLPNGNFINEEGMEMNGRCLVLSMDTKISMRKW
jgi:hypothetical protein